MQIFDKTCTELYTKKKKGFTISITLFVHIANNIGDAGGNELAKALGQNTSITHLDVSENCIGPEGLKSLCKALTDNNNLTHLNISCKKRLPRYHRTFVV